MYLPVMAYLAAAISGAFLIFWEFGNGKINWIKFSVYSCLFIVSLFLTVEDILHKEQSTKETETLVIREIREDHNKIQRQIDTLTWDMHSIMFRKDSLEQELRRRR